MSSSALPLLLDLIDKQLEKKRTDEAEAFFGLRGVNDPTAAEKDAYLRGQGTFTPTPTRTEEADDGHLRQYFDPGRGEEIEQAMIRNRPQVETFKTALHARNAGIDPKDLGETWKADMLRRLYEQGHLTPEQQVGGLTGHDISPFQISNNTRYNRFTGDMQTTPAGQSGVDLERSKLATERAQQGLLGAKTNTEGAQQDLYRAQAGLYGAQREDQAARTGVVRDFASNPEADPLMRVDAANKQALFKGDRIGVLKPDGTTVYFDRTPNLRGGYDYAPAQDAAGGELRVPPSGQGGAGGGGKAAAGRGYQFQALEDEAKRLFDISDEEAHIYATAPAAEQTRMAQRWLESGRTQRVKRGKQAVQTWGEKEKQRVDALFNPKPGAAPAAASAPAPATAPAAGAAPAEKLYSQAAGALKTGKNPAAVRELLLKRGLDPRRLGL